MSRVIFGISIALMTGFAARAAVIKEYPIPAGTFPNFITPGPDGNMWFTLAGGDWIASFSLDGTTFRAYATKTAGCTPIGILSYSDRLWYTCTGLDKLGAVDVHGNNATDFTISPRPAGPFLVDGLGAFWYSSGDAVVRYNGAGTTTVHAGIAGASLFGLVYRDGFLFAADQAHNNYESFNAVAATDAGSNETTGPPYLVTVCNGSLWFTVPSENFIEDGVGNGYAPNNPGGAVEGIACGPDGSIWYTNPGANRIGRFRPGPNTFEEFPVPTPNATPYGIAVAPDGSVWFTENTANKIGRLFLHPPGDVNGDGIVDVADVFYLINFLFAGGPAPAP